jgi:EAL domain-containing protein (putative c-di-GMP-specific phosphodiesterase class I)
MFVAQRLQKVLSVPFNLQGHTIVTTASIGIVTNEQDYESAEDILRDADTAMYHAKQSGRAQCAVFDDTMRQDVLNRLKVERDLHEAITHEQFEAHYQPIVSLDTAMLTGFEALIRWSHPGMGRVAPEQFIEIAEDIGLIVPIGYWMIRQGCHQLKQWELRHESLTMGINLSKRQLMQPDLIERVGNIIADTGIDPRRLKFDITESAITDERNDPSETLDELRGMGIELCMDDFGSGLSSLSCIHEYPIDIIKIDHAFLKHLAVNREYAALVQAIITLAHTLDMRVVAEGVETRSQLLQLQALECDMAQGFLFSNPVCASRATELLDTSSFAQLLQPERGSRSA